MGMGTDDKIGNGNGREWETTCMGMALILMGINSHWLMQYLVVVVVVDMTIMLLMTYLRLMTILFYSGTS